MRGHGKDLTRAIGPYGLYSNIVVSKSSTGPRQPKVWRNAALEYFKRKNASVGLDAMRFVVIVGVIPVGVAVMMVAAATQKQNADNVNNQSEHCDRDGLIEANGNGPNEPRNGFVSDQQRNQGKDNALENPARSPSLPVPNEKRASSA